MSNHTRTVVANMPAELLGLNSWSFHTADQVLPKNPEQVGSTFTQRIFTDVAYRIAQNGPYSEGYYFLVGGYATGGLDGSFPQLAVFSGNAPIFSYSLDDVGGSGVGYMEALYSIACVAPHAAASFQKIVVITNHAVSGALALYTTTPDGTSLETKAAWSLGGDALGGTPTPVSGWPIRVAIARDTSTKYFYVAGKKVGSAGATKAMTRKLYTADDTNDWSALTVPDAGGSDGYTKLVISKDGYLMALTDTGTLDVGNGSNPTTFFTTSASGIRDIAYSYRTDKFYKVSNTVGVSSTPAGSWSSGGPVNWTVENSSINNGVAGGEGLITPLELPYRGTAAPSLSTATADAWFLIYYRDSGRTFVTRDWAIFYPVSIPGLYRHAGSGKKFPTDFSYMKFVGERLFVFTPRGVAISGPLGIKPMYNMGE